MHGKTKRTGSGFYLFIARVCPAAGEPDLKTSPPIKWKHESRANSPFVHHQERNRESTMPTVVVNIYKEQFDAYIGRAGRGEDGYFGNPFRMVNGTSREDAVQKFQKKFTERIEKDSEFRRRVPAQYLKTLAS
jgi:hypothetical protein